jgi:hypothetical protein
MVKVEWDSGLMFGAYGTLGDICFSLGLLRTRGGYSHGKQRLPMSLNIRLPPLRQRHLFFFAGL